MIETINVVNKEVSKILKLDEELVKIVNKFYWRYGVKQAIQSGEHTSIFIRNIGTLTISRTKVNRKIVKIIGQIRTLLNPERQFKVKTREQCIEEKYVMLRTMLKRRNDIAIAYTKNNQRAKERYDTKTSMGQQATNTTRDCFQALIE